MPNYLITGANRGLGLEFVRQLLARGDSVVACCRNPDQAADLRALGETAGERFRLLTLDVADPAAIAALPGQLDDAVVDVLINNAGVAAAEEKFGQFDAEAMERILRINAVAPMLVTQAVAPILEKSGTNPKVVCITSGLGSITPAKDLTFGLSYGMSKAALNMGAKKLSGEMQSRGITIIVMHPGWVQTDMGGSSAPLKPERSISGMLKVIDGLTEADNGRFLTYSGGTLPW